MSTAPDETGLAAARAWSTWHLGDPQWASDIVWAYLNPDEALQRLADEQGEPV